MKRSPPQEKIMVKKVETTGKDMDDDRKYLVEWWSVEWKFLCEVFYCSCFVSKICDWITFISSSQILALIKFYKFPLTSISIPYIINTQPKCTHYNSSGNPTTAISTTRFSNSRGSSRPTLHTTSHNKRASSTWGSSNKPRTASTNCKSGSWTWWGNKLNWQQSRWLLKRGLIMMRLLKRYWSKEW